MGEIDTEDTANLNAQLRALGDPTRFKIVQLLRTRQHCPRSLALTLGITESAVSQQMSVLKKTGLVRSFRHGYHIHYVLEEEALEQMVAGLQCWVDHMGETKSCHGPDSCEFRLQDDSPNSAGCLYRDVEHESA